MPATSLLVGVDGSAGARLATAFARDTALAMKAKLTLLYVIEPFPNAPLTVLEETQSAHYSRQLKSERKLLRELADELGLGPAEHLIEMGRPAEVICREADDRSVDLVVVGSRNGSSTPFLLGSVSDRVAALATSSVVIVR